MLGINNNATITHVTKNPKHCRSGFSERRSGILVAIFLTCEGLELVLKNHECEHQAKGERQKARGKRQKAKGRRQKAIGSDV